MKCNSTPSTADLISLKKTKSLNFYNVDLSLANNSKKTTSSLTTLPCFKNYQKKFQNSLKLDFKYSLLIKPLTKTKKILNQSKESEKKETYNGESINISNTLYYSHLNSINNDTKTKLLFSPKIQLHTKSASAPNTLLLLNYNNYKLTKYSKSCNSIMCSDSFKKPLSKKNSSIVTLQKNFKNKTNLFTKKSKNAFEKKKNFKTTETSKKKNTNTVNFTDNNKKILLKNENTLDSIVKFDNNYFLNQNNYDSENSDKHCDVNLNCLLYKDLKKTNNFQKMSTNFSLRQNFSLEDALLFQQPVLPPNPNFFCCFYKFHITTVAKVLSVLYVFFYGLLCVLSYKSQHSPSFLISIFVTCSVGGCTCYATFKWSKLCLIPFFLLQVILVLYSIICILIVLYFKFFAVKFNFFNLEPKTLILLMFIGLTLLILFLCYSALLFWYEYQFISEVDRFLKVMRKSLVASKDEFNNINGNF